MATSRQSARNCGPRRWAGAWCSCSRSSPRTNPRDLGCRIARKSIHRRTASRCDDFLRLPSWLSGETRHARPAQRCFGFLVRSHRLARRFKAAILLGTSLVVVVTLASSSSGRYLAGWLATRSRWAVLQGIGISPGRDEIDADWRRRRAPRHRTNPREAAIDLRRVQSGHAQAAGLRRSRPRPCALALG